jgi:hypothetical protein
MGKLSVYDFVVDVRWSRLFGWLEDIEGASLSLPLVSQNVLYLGTEGAPLMHSASRIIYVFQWLTAIMI